MSGGGKGGQTIGYHYLFSILFGLGRGPFDELRAIKAGDKLAWEGHVCAGDLQAINKPDLFGGEKKEGGVQGLFRLHQGGQDQVLPGAESGSIITLGGFKFEKTEEGLWELIFKAFAGGPYNGVRTLPDVKAMITGSTGGIMGELRGRVTLWFDGLISSMNPYIKEWKFRVRRSRKGWHNDNCWYPDKATIFLADGLIFAMNPAHIIYECCTNPAWGRGLDPASRIDDNSFTLAANTFCEESFGLCLVWYRKEDIEQFIQVVLDHVGAVLYTDRETGKLCLKPIRNDYDIADLPVFTKATGLVDIEEDDSGSGETALNEVIVSGHDPITDTDIQMPAHNLAAFRAQGAPSSASVTYKGLPTKELCARVAQRDLKASAAGLRKFKVVLNRRGFRLHPGAVFRVQCPERGIADIVLRAGEIDDGNAVRGWITVAAVQDVFGLPSASFAAPTDPVWTPPSSEPQPADIVLLEEASYRQAYLVKGAGDAETLQAGDSYLIAYAGKPAVRTMSYDLITRPEGDTTWTTSGEFFFTGTAVLTADLSATATSFTVENQIEFPDGDLAGQAMTIGDETLKIVSYDTETNTFTVTRGVIDSWPRPHAAGARVWLIDDDGSSDGKPYADGETVEAKVLTRSWSSAQDESEADLLTVALAGRIARPYPPAAVTVDGDSIYAMSGEYNEPTFAWNERNRLTQADVLVGFFDATMTPEAGTTYRLRVYESADATVAAGTHDGIASGWQYTIGDQTADGVETRGVVWIELVSVRDGYESWKPYRFPVVLRSGWGYTWGFNWGGDPA